MILVKQFKMVHAMVLLISFVVVRFDFSHLDYENEDDDDDDDDEDDEDDDDEEEEEP